jgi:hypothetical protein
VATQEAAATVDPESDKSDSAAEVPACRAV